MDLGPLFFQEKQNSFVLFMIEGTEGISAFILTFGHCHKKCKGSGTLQDQTEEK